MVGKAGQDMKEAKVQARIDKFGSIHFTLKSNLNVKEIEVQWNKFVGEEVTPELIKKELEKIKKVFKE